MKMKSRFMVFLFTLIAAVIGCSAGVSAEETLYDKVYQIGDTIDIPVGSYVYNGMRYSSQNEMKCTVNDALVIDDFVHTTSGSGSASGTTYKCTAVLKGNPLKSVTEYYSSDPSAYYNTFSMIVASPGVQYKGFRGIRISSGDGTYKNPYRISAVTPTNSAYISFNANDGNEPSWYVIWLRAGENKMVDQPEDPTREGYIFDGWYSDRDLTTRYDFSTIVTADVALYAKWTMITPANYSVRYNWDGDECTAVIMLYNGTTETVEMTKQTDGTWTGTYNGETLVARQVGIKSAEKTFARQKNNDGTTTDKATMSVSVGLDPSDKVYLTNIGFVVTIGDTTKTFSKSIRAYAANYKLALKIPQDKSLTYYYFYEKSDGSETVTCEPITESPLV